jgi:uncharacterized protein YoaH (UPF0181 family)
MNSFVFIVSLRFSSADSAADLFPPAALSIHCLVFCHPLPQPGQDLPHQRIAVLRPAVVDPFPIPSGIHQTGAFKPGKMSRYFGLNHTERIGQFANAGISTGEQIEQAQAGRIRQCFKKDRRLASSIVFHFPNIYMDKRICVKIDEANSFRIPGSMPVLLRNVSSQPVATNSPEFFSRARRPKLHRRFRPE